MKIPKKYLTKNPRVMKKEIKKHADKPDSDSSAYDEWDADYKSGKAGKGKPVETKKSKYTTKYQKMYGESMNILNFEQFNEAVEIAAYEVFLETVNEDINEGVDSPSSPVNKALKNKSDKTRFPLGILKQVWKDPSIDICNFITDKRYAASLPPSPELSKANELIYYILSVGSTRGSFARDLIMAAQSKTAQPHIPENAGLSLY